VPLLRHSVRILMQSSPPELLVAEMRAQIEAVRGVDAVHALHVWSLSPGTVVGSVHVRMCAAEMRKFNAVLRQVKAVFHRFEVHKSTVQPHFVNCELVAAATKSGGDDDASSGSCCEEF